ncbi:MAG: hypothetical protein M1820_000265 [Bogoriella megaspora]|nr:MAG: hypothetical protein M1820_000265 [Bogoriella megaspora]
MPAGSTNTPSSIPDITLPPFYTLLNTIPDSETYVRLRYASGLTPHSLTAATIGLPKSIHAVQIQHDPSQTIVGMGRIVGDGALFFLVVDIAVDPAHQKKGLGKAIMSDITKWIAREAPEGAYASLVADGEAKRLYRIFGWREVVEHGSVGMYWHKKAVKKDQE